MKYFYPVIGLLVLVGIAYASYNYGINKGLVPANNTVANNTVISNTNIPVINDGNPNVNVEAKTLTIASPNNGQVIAVVNDPMQGSNPTYFSFSLTGTVSPNANKIRVKVYAKGVFDLSQPAFEKQVDDYYLTKFKLGDTSWSYKVSSAPGGSLMGDSSRFVVTAYYTDNSTKSVETKVTYERQTAEMGKPVIYLYPTTKQLVSVNVKPTSGISYSEPAIGNGWKVTASPDGTLVDASGKTWPYLFWEGFASNFVTPKAGFVVAKNEVSSFFDDKLATLGLNAKEIADFKEFWMPRMQDKSYYFVTFVPQATFDTYAPLTVSPTPDTVIRVFFDYKGLDKPMTVPAQILPATPVRNGFTVVEWGGRIYR